MKQKQILQEKSREEVLNDYITILEKTCKDFACIKSAYNKACIKLRKEFKYMDEIIKFKKDMLISKLEFSFEKGLHENIRHFLHHKECNFLDNNYDDSLNEKEMCDRFDCLQAYIEQQKLLEFLPIELMSSYEDIIEYEVFLDTYIPKMAHYYGFVMGDSELKKCQKL